MRQLCGSMVSQRIGAGGNQLSAIGDDEETGGGDPRFVVEPLEVAVETCATRMARLQEIPKVSRGIAFGIDVEPGGPKTMWSVVFHRGPLPLVEIELSDLTGFHPPLAWLDSIVESKCAHAVSRKAGRLSGGGDLLFLMLKRRELFPYSKGNSSNEAVAAGQSLRKLCREAWLKQSNNTDSSYELSPYQWRRKQFVRKFDRMLIEYAGSDNLSAILKKMGTRLESWLPACE